MAKKHEREEDELKRLHKEIRELKSINRTLTRKLKKLDKGYTKSIEDEEDSKEEQLTKQISDSEFHEILINCEDCGKGYLKEVNLMGRLFIQCTSCGPKGRKK